MWLCCGCVAESGRIRNTFATFIGKSELVQLQYSDKRPHLRNVKTFSFSLPRQGRGLSPTVEPSLLGQLGVVDESRGFKAFFDHRLDFFRRNRRHDVLH